MAKWGGLPSIVSALPNDLRNFLQRVKDTLEGAMSGSSRFVTAEELVNGNLATLDTYGNLITTNSGALDYSPPPAPTNLIAAGALTTILLQWDTPGYANHAHAEIWRAATDNLGVAALIGTASGVLYADSVDAGSTYYYWVRFISKASIPGAYNATAGVNGTTSQNPAELLAILTGEITSSQLHATLGSRINLIDAVNTGLVTQIGTANQSVDDMAAALIQSTLDKADLLDKLARERAISDATVVVDPLTGTVTLLAEAAITTDVEARITTVETNLNAAAGTANTAVARLDVIGAVDEFGVPLTGTLHAMNAAIETNTDGLALKASSTYVEAALAGVNDYIASEADLPLALMRLFLSGGNAIPIMQAAHIRVAHAEQTLTTHTDALSAEAQARLTLAALVDNNLAALVSEQTARADADGAIATNVTQLQARLDTGDYAAVKTESSTSASAITGLSAEYSLKLDVNGFVSGYGTVNDGTSSEFLIATNKFGIVAPTLNSDTEPVTKYHGLIWKNTSAGTVAGVPPGASRRWMVVGGVGSWQLVGFGALPFAVLTTATTINGTEFQPGVYIDGASVVEATIGNAQISNAAVDDAKVANLSAAKVTFGEMSGDRISTNSLSADRIKAGTLLAGSWIKVQAPGAAYGTTIHSDGYIATEGAINRTVMTDGNVITYRKVGGAEYPYKSLSHVENGVAANNTNVTIPGYFVTQPKVIVSPAALTLYKAAYANQDQSVRCEALNLQETSFGSMQWGFTPKAQLELAANTGSTVLNAVTSPAAGTNSWVSATYTAPANTASINLSVDITSVRGTGTAGQYYFRQVTWRVVYWNGSAWVSGAWKTKVIGATVSAVSDTNTFAFPSSAAWQFYVEYLASDAGGTFSTGGVQYNYDTIYKTSAGPITADTGYRTTYASISAALDLGAYSPPATWEVYGATYGYDVAYLLTSDSYRGGTASVMTPAFSASRNTPGVEGDVNLNTYAAKTYSSGSYTGTISETATYTPLSTNPGGGQAAVRIKNGTATISIRQLVTNSATPSNSSTFQGYSYSLTSAQVLASGTLNWMAIGD